MWMVMGMEEHSMWGVAIKGNRIDVFLPSEAECRRWGVRTVKVYILE
ncbi:3D domain-containing protein [Syntrophaceticus schinkii]